MMPITFLTNEDYTTLEGIHGDLDDLQTTDKSSLVAAINEAANSGGIIAQDTAPNDTGLLWIDTSDEIGDETPYYTKGEVDVLNAANVKTVNNVAPDENGNVAIEVGGDDGAVTTAGDGAVYTATVDGITALTAGVSFTMIPHVTSTSQLPTLDVNGLGAKKIRRRVSNSTVTTVISTSENWLFANKPIRMLYDGSSWIADMDRPNATDIYGAVAIANGGTGATDAAAALTNLGAIPAPETAAVGQTIKVSAVDENGKPTAWEAVDFPSGGGGVKPFRLLRTVVVPTDASTDTSGVTWLERSEGGYWFGFDTDADGNPFEVSELIIVNEEAAAYASGIFTYHINRGATPYYGDTGSVLIAYEPKTARSWQWIHFLGLFTQWFGAKNGGSDVANVQADRFMNTALAVDKCTSIFTLFKNGQNVGLTAGKISFYGR